MNKGGGGGAVLHSTCKLENCNFSSYYWSKLYVYVEEGLLIYFIGAYMILLGPGQ